VPVITVNSDNGGPPEMVANDGWCRWRISRDDGKQ